MELFWGPQVIIIRFKYLLIIKHFGFRIIMFNHDKVVLNNFYLKLFVECNS